MSVFDVLIGILGLALLMVVHEAGHLLAARAFGMRVTTFSIGFGPTFFKVEPQDGYFWFTTFGGRVRLRLGKHDPEKHGPTVYQVAMIPFLAYV
ncbi:MAG TPA: site-2 protease family protein, partial [Polyangiaceae bacterium]|nr:site-2 protease family protein [Polyangiaceae bacterium]